MLVQFTVRNFKTFRDEAKLSMVATSDDTREAENIIPVPAFNLRLLKSAVIYGANASGKSRLLEAMGFMDNFIQNSSKNKQIKEKTGVDPFRLNTVSKLEPSFFEMIFIHEGEMFRYGFEATDDEVTGEWLYQRQSTKEAELFFRKRQEFEHVNEKKFRIGNRLVKDGMVRPNALLLSLAAQHNDPVAIKIFEWFTNFNIISGLTGGSQILGYTLGQMDDPSMKRRIVETLKAADILIEDVVKKRAEPDDLPENLKKMAADGTEIFSFRMVHPVFDEAGNPAGKAEFSMETDESAGTYKFFSFLGFILGVLEISGVLLVDELDARLHPNLVGKLLSLFHSTRSKAQLIFNTHDSNLLSSGLFRRDQIWFTEKDRYGAASLFSLANFSARKNDNFEDKYLQGKYGAVPYLGEFSRLFEKPETVAAQ